MNLIIPEPGETTDARHEDPRLLVIYGPAKSGKTEMLAKLPRHLIMDTEDGTAFLKCTAQHITSDKSITDWHKLIPEIIEKKFDFVAVDTISRFEDFCEPIATRIYKKSTLGKRFTGDSVLDLPHGYGYRYLREVMRKYLFEWKLTAPRVIFTAHIRDKEIETKDGAKSLGKDLDLTGKLTTIVAAEADAVGYVYRLGSALRISFKNLGDVTAGCRSKHLAGKDLPFKWEHIYKYAPGIEYQEPDIRELK